MLKIILFLKKIRHILLFFEISITIVATTIYLFNNFSITNLLSILIAIGLFAAMGLDGPWNFKVQYRIFNTPEMQDLNTLLFCGVGFVALIVFAILFLILYYNETITLITIIIGGLAIGGTTNLYERRRYQDNRLPRKKRQRKTGDG